MAYIDYSTFTEQDPSNYWSQTATRNTFTGLEISTNNYVYKDYGVGYFQNFDYWFDCRLTASNSHSLALTGIFRTSNTLGAYGGNNIAVAFAYSSGNKLYLHNFGLSVGDYSSAISLDTTYYCAITRIDTTVTLKIYTSASDRSSDINLFDTLTITSDTTAYRYLYGGFSRYGGSWGYTMSGYVENLKSTRLILTKEETVTLSDEIALQLSLEPLEFVEILNVVDSIKVSPDQQTDGDSLSVSDTFSFLATVKKNIENAINTAKEVLSDGLNIFHTFIGYTDDVSNKMNMKRQDIDDVDNDFRMIADFQKPSSAGFLSLGKEYIKIYINSVEQTDINIDSITVTQSLNSPHTATFMLGRPYDSTSKPGFEEIVEIKYHIWTLFKGYVTAISPGNVPDSIQINCQDEYWKQNRTKKYFNVGHKPQDNTELYYSYISTALSSQFAWSPGVGGFVPQVINCFGTGSSDCISQLIESSGNNAWFYHVDKSTGVVTRKLWTAGNGATINLERQAIGKNISLYQVIKMKFVETIDNLVNRYRVKMGDSVVRVFNDTGGSKEYANYRFEYSRGSAVPNWNKDYEVLAKDNDNAWLPVAEQGTGVFDHPESLNEKYGDVFVKYSLPDLDSNYEKWTDVFAPVVTILVPFHTSLGTDPGEWQLNSVGDNEDGHLESGFTIDYDNRKLIFNEPIYLKKLDENGEIEEIRAPLVHLQLWKKKYYSETDNPNDDPEDENDITNPMIFLTPKMGTYPITITENLDLTSFSIQIGGWYRDANDDLIQVPSWNDTAFALDFANWQLSKTCDIKTTGTVEVTIDTMCFYDINLSHRIMIDGAIDESLNIQSISYNIGSWTASLTLENGRYYKRTVSLPSHGE